MSAACYHDHERWPERHRSIEWMKWLCCPLLSTNLICSLLARDCMQWPRAWMRLRTSGLCCILPWLLALITPIRGGAECEVKRQFIGYCYTHMPRKRLESMTCFSSFVIAASANHLLAPPRTEPNLRWNAAILIRELLVLAMNQSFCRTDSVRSHKR